MRPISAVRETVSRKDMIFSGAVVLVGAASASGIGTASVAQLALPYHHKVPSPGFLDDRYCDTIPFCFFYKINHELTRIAAASAADPDAHRRRHLHNPGRKDRDEG